LIGAPRWMAGKSRLKLEHHIRCAGSPSYNDHVRYGEKDKDILTSSRPTGKCDEHKRKAKKLCGGRITIPPLVQSAFMESIVPPGRQVLDVNPAVVANAGCISAMKCWTGSEVDSLWTPKKQTRLMGEFRREHASITWKSAGNARMKTDHGPSEWRA